jgi:AAA+ superfamily predicted ATPase
MEESASPRRAWPPLAPLSIPGAPMPTPQQVEALTALIDTRTALLVIETHEEKRVMALFERVANLSQREVWTWSVSRGLRVNHGLKLSLLDFDKNPVADANETKELPDALRHIDKATAPALIVFLDVHPYLSNPVITRALKEIALKSETKGQQLVFVGHDVELPDELLPFASRFELEPMTIERVKALFKEETSRHKSRQGSDITGCRKTLDSLLRHMVGLPEASVRHLVRLTLNDGVICTADLARVLAAKQETLGVAELLVFEQKLPALDEVAGMKALKRWLLLRREPFLQPDTSGLPPPRGVLLLGVQGAGKSLSAKAIASSWQVPLFRMDFGALFDKYQGESERKLREALKVADAMSPCVLWMDEIEKGLAGGQGDGDTGAGKRMLGTLLTWMAERRSSVFLVATANDIESLPPELMRKGRFDEIFFVDLPTPEVRDGILRIHLQRHKVPFDDAGLTPLVERSEGFSGAEIEAAVVAARYEAHARQKTPQAEMVMHELLRTKPLSVTRAEAVARLREWAADRTVSAD